MQHRLKATSGTARTEVLPPEFLHQLPVAVDDAIAAFHARFGRIPAPALARALKSSGVGCGSCGLPYATSCRRSPQTVITGSAGGDNLAARRWFCDVRLMLRPQAAR